VSRGNENKSWWSAVAVPDRYRNAALFVLLSALFGGAFAAIKIGLAELPPVLFAAHRFDVAAVALLGYLVVFRPREVWFPRTRADFAGIAVGAVFLITFSNGLLFAGQATITPAAASVMFGLNPVLAPVFAWVLLGDRLSRVGILGICVALAGVVVMVRPSPSSLVEASAVGQLLVLCAAVAVALGSVWLRRVDPPMGSLPLTAWAMAVGAVLLHAVSFVLGDPQTALLGASAATVWSVVVVGLPSTAVAYTIYFGLIRRIGPVRVNLVAYVVPVFAALTGWLVLGSTVSVWTVVGFLVVVVGFGLVERETLRAELRRLHRRTVPAEN
jgi:drug/metabolite transporter (DMT)-like permease